MPRWGPRDFPEDVSFYNGFNKKINRFESPQLCPRPQCSAVISVLVLSPCLTIPFLRNKLKKEILSRVHSVILHCQVTCKGFYRHFALLLKTFYTFDNWKKLSQLKPSFAIIVLIKFQNEEWRKYCLCDWFLVLANHNHNLCWH